MSATATILIQQPAKPPTPGVGLRLLPCCRCGDDNAYSLHLDDETFECHGCGESLTAEYLRDLFRRWQPVLAWVEQLPRAKE